jgi:glycosyltransferase involved in cell wall biosynthesis
MKICFISHAGHPNARRWIEYFATQLRHEVHVISVTKEPHPVPGAIMHDILIDIERKWRYLLAVPKVRRVLKKISPDLVIAYRVQSSGVLAAFTGFHPLVLAAQDEDIVHPVGSRLSRSCVKFAIRRGDAFNAWGENMARNLCRLGAPRDRIIVRPRGVRTDIFLPGPTGARRNGRPTVCTTRGLYALYGHGFLLEVIDRLRHEVADVLLTLMGSGPEEEAIRRDIARRDLGRNVRLLGRGDQHAVASLLQRSDVYVSVKSTDGVSSSLLEAMACGTFPVVADVPANRPWVRHLETGLLTADGDVSAYVRHLKRALEDDELRARAAAANVAFVQRELDWAVTMRRMEAEYARLVHVGSIA